MASPLPFAHFEQTRRERVSNSWDDRQRRGAERAVTQDEGAVHSKACAVAEFDSAVFDDGRGSYLAIPVDDAARKVTQQVDPDDPVGRCGKPAPTESSNRQLPWSDRHV